MRQVAPLPLLGALALATALLGCPPRRPAATLPHAVVSVAGHRIQVEVADSVAARIRGLSGREGLAADHGMLFPYAVAGRRGFWMKGMHFDLDLIWIRDKRIVDMTLRVPHAIGEFPPVYRPAEPVNMVLEVPAGTAQRLGWRRGDPVSVDPPWPFSEGSAP